MKKIITNLKKMSLGIFASLMFTGNINATTYTASQSGNWSSALTWGGAGSPGSTIGSVDNVVIPAGITVTMDMDVTVNSLLSYINVGGSLTSATNSLTITQGALQGTGTMNLTYVEIGSLGSISFSGTMTADRFVNSGATLSITGDIIVNDSLLLNSGSIAFSSGSNLALNANSTIKVDAGSMSVSGGTLVAANPYNLIYVGSSKTSGIETGISSGANNIWVSMSDSSQVITLGNDVTVSNTLNIKTGKLAIGAHTLKLSAGYAATAKGKINGSAASRLILNFTSLPSPIVFSANSQLQYLEINLATPSITHFASNFTVDTFNLKNGSADFSNASSLMMASNGLFIWEDGTFSLGAGSFVGTNSYSVLYKGPNKGTSFETSGSGLKNVTVSLTSSNNTLSLYNNLTVAGLLNMDIGHLYLDGHNLTLSGTYTSTTNGILTGHSTSILKINNITTAFGDTLRFPTVVPTSFDSIIINTMPSSWVPTTSSFSANNIKLMSGGLMLTNGDLTINSPGVISGYDSTKYIGINGSGSLIMNVNTASPYVKFPVGTNLDYSPANVQLVTGTSGTVSVNVHNGMWTNGTNGIDLALTQSVVNRSWNIQSAQNGTLNANVQVEWKSAEEMHSFDRTHSFISHYTNSAWDASTVGAANHTAGSYYQLTRSNLSSFGPFAVVDQNSATGIDKLTNSNNTLGLYPNPTSNFVIIDLKNTDAKSIELYDEIGNKVFSNEILNKNSLQNIDVSTLPSGIYYVKIATFAEPVFKKLIKS